MNTMTDIVQTIFGLRQVKNTPVGDAAIRGVSGGEKKRVSIGEVIALRSTVNAWDKWVLSAALTVPC
jgi:ATP-binding cassette subfamily G (WHITE) protein 2 (SNQ2)